MKIICILSIFLLFLVLTSKCYALAPFTAPAELNITYLNENWNETEHTQATVLFENGILKQWYTSRINNLHIASSYSNNGVYWINSNVLNLFTNSLDDYDPSILKVGDSYYLYFASANSEVTKIMRIRSADGMSFDSSSLLSVLSPSNTWETNDVNSPALYYENNVYFLFYTGHNDKWNTGLAISDDGISFTKCPNNPILTNDAVPKSVIKLSNTYYLFFHSPNGIEYMETDRLGCDSVWSNRTVALPYGFFPYVIQNGNELWMYFSVLDNGHWKMYLAKSKLDIVLNQRKPIVLIPGMFASWNKKAVLHNEVVSSSDWRLNPFVKEYDALSKTLMNQGYENNTDYFVFPFDWRQPVERSSDDLNTFINKLNLSEKPSLVGHSLGGLVGRIYAQKYGTSKIEKLVTVGTPHQGTALVYPAVEAGETDKRDQKMWLSEKLILQLYRDGLETDKGIINTHFPVLRDLLPTYNYLIKGDQTIRLDSMTYQNNLLPAYNSSLGPLYSQLHAVVGQTGSTVSGYAVEKRSLLDTLLNYYPDGRPTGPTYLPGDGTIITFSATLGNNVSTLNKNHGQLVYSKEGVKTILQALDIPSDVSTIEEGQATSIFPSLIFLMLSPADMQVESNGIVYHEKEGMILIEDPAEGVVTIHANGKAKGRYSILIGQISENDSVWDRIEGEITSDPPSKQTDTYSFAYNPTAPDRISLTPEQQFHEISLLLNDLEAAKVSKTRAFLTKAYEAYRDGKPEQTHAFLRQTVQSIMQDYTNSSSIQKQKLIAVLPYIEILYGSFPQSRSVLTLKVMLANIKAENIALQEKLLKSKSNSEQIESYRFLLSELAKKMSQAEKALANGQHSEVEILVHTGKLLKTAITRMD